MVVKAEHNLKVVTTNTTATIRISTRFLVATLRGRLLPLSWYERGELAS